MASNEHFESQLFNFDNEDIIESKKEVCTLCKVGEIKREGDPTPMTVYTKDGVRIIRHYYKRCNFQAKNAECRASYTLGSLSFNGKRIYEDDALKNKYLITSNQTGFSIDFLVASDFYYSVVRDNTLRFKNALVAVDTNFDYNFCGNC